MWEKAGRRGGKEDAAGRGLKREEEGGGGRGLQRKPSLNLSLHSILKDLGNF